MKKRRVSVVLLSGLLLVFCYLVWSRLSVRMGGAPAELSTEFQSEEEWLLREILMDIGEMSFAAPGVTTDAFEEIGFELSSNERDTESQEWHVRLELSGRHSALERDVLDRESPLGRTAFTRMALTLLAGTESSPESDSDGDALLRTLLEIRTLH